MGIKKDKTTGRWRCRWWDSGAEHSKLMPKGCTREDAERFLRDVKTKIDRINAGLEVRERNPQGLTVAELATRYIRGRDARLVSAVTLHIIRPSLGALPLERCTAARIQGHLEEMQPIARETQRTPAKLSQRTRNHVRKHLVQVFAYGIERGLWVGENPARAVKPGKVKKRALVTLTAQEASRLVLAVQQPWRGIIAVALHGLRRGEVFGLNVADVDLERSELLVRRSHSKDLTKNDRERVVPIHPMLRGAIADAVELATGRGGPLFPGRDGKRRHERASVEVPFGRALRLAGITRHVRLHDLRHTAATLMLQAGAPVAHVSKILGHSSIQITVDTYGHLLTDDLHAAMGRVDLTPAPLRAVDKK